MADTTFLTKKSDGAGNLILDIGTLGADTHVLVGHNLSPVEIAVTTTATATLNRWHRCTGTSADYTVTLPACSGNAGKLIGFIMDAALTKLITIDGNASETIDGSLTRIMWAKETCILRVNDAGTEWEKVGGKSIPMSATLGMSGNQTFSNNTSTLLTFTVLLESSCPAAFVTSATPKFTIQRPGRYIITTEGITNGNNATACYEQLYIYKNASALRYSQVNSPANTYMQHKSMFVDSLAVSDYLQPYGKYEAGSHATSYLLDDSAAPLLNFFSIQEICNW